MNDQYAEVIVDISNRQLDHTFTYGIGDDLRGRIEPGMVVEVPFGRSSKLVRGYVVRLSESAGVHAERVKNIQAVITDGLGEDSRLISLAVWMHRRYGCSMAQALGTVIPVKKKIQQKDRTILHLLLAPDAAQEKLAYYQKKNQKARYRLLAALMDSPDLPRELVTEKLQITTAVIRALKEQGVLEIIRQRVWRMPAVPKEKISTVFPLTQEQKNITDRLCRDWSLHDSPGKYLLHGITGSGKTAVYMELIAYMTARGRQVIFLIPEISLTYQTLMRMYSRFGSQVSVIHSGLSQGERSDQFERARQGEVSIIIGPRSALFTPFSHLGLIIIDEEHEGAYISESMPRYHAVETARRRCEIEGAHLLLGSATPSLDSYSRALKGEYTLLELNERAAGGALPETQIVDMRSELLQGFRSPISRPLAEALRETLEKKEQAMLFLNRRGLSSFVSCRSCGKPVRCPHCDISLSLHSNGKMICHICGYEIPAVKQCPSCASPFIRGFRAGTQQVEQELHRLLPGVRVLRMDADTTAQKDSAGKLLASFRDHEADILIGTQMIVKGHDFPDVTLMGILAADLSLNTESYMAAERTFQLITQAAGRAGRSMKPGRAIIQTYQPDHYAICTAAAQNYREFYAQEMSYRKMGGYPPVGALTALWLSTPDEDRLQAAAYYLGKYARYIAARSKVTVLGPTDPSVAKIQDQYRKVLYLKGEEENALGHTVECLMEYVKINEGFRNMRILVDIGG